MNKTTNDADQGGLEFYTDSHGSPCARGDDERLAVYLQTDLQGSVAATKELLNLLQQADYRGEFNGNAHCVEINEKSVRIEALFDDEAPDRRLSREEMQKSLNAWLEFIA